MLALAWQPEDEAAQQGDAADEAGASDGASQLIPGVGRTAPESRGSADKTREAGYSVSTAPRSVYLLRGSPGLSRSYSSRTMTYTRAHPWRVSSAMGTSVVGV